MRLSSRARRAARRSGRCSARRPCAGCRRRRTARARSGSPAPAGSGRRRSGRCRRRRPASGTRRSPGRRRQHDRGAALSTCARPSTVDLARRTSRARPASGVVTTGHPHAGRRDLQVGDAEDLAGLVADLELLGRPAVVLERARPRHHVERERRRERRLRRQPVGSACARRRPPGRASGRRRRASSSSYSRSMPGHARAGGRLVGGDDQLAQPVLARAARRARPSSSASCSWGWR